MTSLVAWMPSETDRLLAWMPATCSDTFWVAAAVSRARSLTSLATTAKPRPSSPGAGGLDGGVERQQVGLVGDGADDPDDVVDGGRRGAERLDLGGHRRGLGHGLLGHPAGVVRRLRAAARPSRAGRGRSPRRPRRGAGCPAAARPAGRRCAARRRATPTARWSRSMKKSIVPTTRPPATIGKQTPDRTPARWAAGARTQSVTSARSRTKTRSRCRHARPERPTPSAKLAAEGDLAELLAGRTGLDVEPQHVLGLVQRPEGAVGPAERRPDRLQRDAQGGGSSVASPTLATTVVTAFRSSRLSRSSRRRERAAPGVGHEAADGLPLVRAAAEERQLAAAVVLQHGGDPVALDHRQEAALPRAGGGAAAQRGRSPSRTRRPSAPAGGRASASPP